MTNDLFRDYLTKGGKPRDEKKWLKRQLVSFTFVKDTFLPNPDAYIFKK